MSEEDTKEKRHKTKTRLPFLLVILSCLFFILALMSLWIPTTPAPTTPAPTTPNPDSVKPCIENISELGYRILEYAREHNGELPKPSKWCDLLIEHTGVSKKLFKCPGAKSGPCNYAMNRNLENIGRLDDITNAHSDMVLLFETYPGWNQVGCAEISTTTNHSGCGSYILLNLVRGLATKQDIHKLKWKPD